MFNQICINEEMLHIYVRKGGASGVMVTIIGNGHGNTSSNPGRD